MASFTFGIRNEGQGVGGLHWAFTVSGLGFSVEAHFSKRGTVHVLVYYAT